MDALQGHNYSSSTITNIEPQDPLAARHLRRLYSRARCIRLFTGSMYLGIHVTTKTHIAFGPTENLAPPLLKVTNAHNQQTLPSASSKSLHVSHTVLPTRMITDSPSRSPGGHDEGLAFTSPPSRRNTRPLTPPYSPNHMLLNTTGRIKARAAQHLPSTSLGQQVAIQFAPGQP